MDLITNYIPMLTSLYSCLKRMENIRVISLYQKSLKTMMELNIQLNI